MIVSLHVATGAGLGALSGRRALAVALGPLLHLLGDRMPHDDIPSYRFELATGVAGVVALAARRGLDAATLGAIAASVPDLEHRLRLPRPKGRKLFPSHRYRRWHTRGGVPAWAQLVAAGVVLGWLLARPR